MDPRRSLRLALLMLALVVGWIGLSASGVAVADDGGVAEADAEIADHQRELRTVEEEVKRLKERVFRSKTTLQLLKELVVEGSAVGSQVVIWHVNRMGPAYTMESVQYYLDGQNIFTRVDPTGALDELREVKVHEATLPPGSHTLQVNMVLRGNGFGVFSYLRTYSFQVKSSFPIEIEDGELRTVRVVANERSGLLRTFVDRPGLQYEETVDTLRTEGIE